MAPWYWTQSIVSGILLIWHHAYATDVKPQKEIYIPDYHIYHNLTDTALHLIKIASKHSDIVRIDWTYRSRNQMPQLLTRITNFSSTSSKSADSSMKATETQVPKVCILLSYGEHAREFFPVESFFHLIKNITNGISSTAGSYEERFSKLILSHFDIYAVVMANPDGRKYLEASNNYCWRGTSTGVDINRNFAWQFALKGSSEDPKDEEYRGPYAFSEPECKVYTDLTERIKFDAFLSFHSGVRHIYMPFADTMSKYLQRVSPNFHDLSELSLQLATATKHKFRFGTAYDLNFYTADGTAFDFMAGVRQVPFSLAIEMWENQQHKGLSCFDEFNPRSEHLMAEVADLHPMYVQLFSYLYEWKLKQLSYRPSDSSAVEAPSMTFNYILLFVIILASATLAYRNRHHVCANKRRIVHLRRLGSTFSVSGIFR